MFFDTARIKGNTLLTHRSSFLLERITAADIQRPLLSISIIPAMGGCTFCLAFMDILYAGEIVTIIGGIVATLICTASVGQLKLVSGDLRGSEVSGAVWGRYRHLKSIHQDITRVWDAKEDFDATI